MKHTLPEILFYSVNLRGQGIDVYSANLAQTCRRQSKVRTIEVSVAI